MREDLRSGYFILAPFGGGHHEFQFALPTHIDGCVIILASLTTLESSSYCLPLKCSVVVDDDTINLDPRIYFSLGA